MSNYPQLFYENRLLAAMAPADHTVLFRHAEWVELRQHDVLSRPHVPNTFAYFPVSGICSVIAVTDDDVRVETGLIGSDGFVGASMILQAGHDPNEVIVQADGRALRLPGAKLIEAFDKRPTVRSVMLRAVYVQGIQSTQTALVNGHFTIEVRLARWLLMYQDRVGNSFPMTHDFLSKMLAVRRAGVTEALHHLESQDLIRSTRGAVTVIDRHCLEVLAGSAYGLPEAEFKRLIKPGSPFLTLLP